MSATDNITVTVGWIARHTPKGAGAGGREAAILDIAQDLLLRDLHETGALDALVFEGGTALRKLYAGATRAGYPSTWISASPPRQTPKQLASRVSTRYAFLTDLDAEERQLARAREQDRDLALRLLAELPGVRLARLGLY